MTSISKKAECALNADAGAGQEFSVYYAGPNTGWIAINHAQAASPILSAFLAEDAVEGNFQNTPFQTADARHSAIIAKELVRGYWSRFA